MTFQEAVRTCFQKYLVIEGRARRAEYWWFVLFSIVASIVIGLLDASFGFTDEFQPLSLLFGLVMFLPSITVAIRRLHDRDMSGWWFLLVLVPLIGTDSLHAWIDGTVDGTDRSIDFAYRRTACPPADSSP